MTWDNMVPGILILACLVVLADCRINHERLALTPPTQRNFNQHKYTGRWHIQAKILSRSWYGSRKFSDWFKDEFEEDDVLLISDTWREGGDCLSVPSRMKAVGPGSYIAQDSIGDMYSGRVRIIATDYRSFACVWGCSEMSADGKTCDDPWISIKTRLRDPHPRTWKTVDRILHHHWGLLLTDLHRVLHREPCDDSDRQEEMFNLLGDAERDRQLSRGGGLGRPSRSRGRKRY